LPDGTSFTYALVKAGKYGSLLATDVPESVPALMIVTERPIDVAALNEKLTSAAWTTKPSWQTRPLQDPVLPAEDPCFLRKVGSSKLIAPPPTSLR
jgi:hypothetical protein